MEQFHINSVTHKYLTRGHTQNEGDCIHSIIPKSKNSGPIHIPNQYFSIIRNSKKKGNPIVVREMSFEDFFDLKSLFDDLGLSLTKNSQADEFKINEIKVMQFEKGSESF